MRVYYINVQQPPKGSDKIRSSIGGRPIFAEGQSRPACKLCKLPMTLFFQFDLPRGYDLPFEPDSHLLVFMCPVHNDIPTDPSEYAERDFGPRYWTRDFGHYALLFNRKPRREIEGDEDTSLKAQRIRFNEGEEEIHWDGVMERGTPGFKVGGVPDWEEQSQARRCSCGADMTFLCQIPAGQGFSKLESAPEQTDAADRAAYTIFAGRPTYIFACKDQCTPYSLYAVSHDIVRQELEIA